MFNLNEINDKPFVIAEVGQNHNGELDLALEYIKVFATCGADAIKFQTRDNKYLFSEDAYNAKYTSENAYADIYGHHREKLELKKEWLPILKKECAKYNVYFMSTPFDEPSLKILEEIDVDVLKIASFDLGNLPFIDMIGKTNKPIVMSIGGGNSKQIESSVEILKKFGNEIAILHCISEYPCDYKRLGLNNIQKLIKKFPHTAIGLSDHFNGILSGPVAYMKGARVFEKHVTLNRGWKGTDHSFALERTGFRKFVRDINRVRHMLKPKPKNEIGTENVFKKLGKSIVSNVDISPGEEVTIEKLSGKIFKSQFIPVRESNNVIGKICKKLIIKGMPISYTDLL